MKTLKIKTMNKRAYTLTDIITIIVTFVTIGIVASFGATVNSEVRKTQTANTEAYNASTNVLAAIQTMTNFFPLLGLIFIAVVIIGLLLTYFNFGQRQG